MIGIGIPYARATFVNGRYGVVCPECDAVFTDRKGSEDDETKGAGRLYGLHYEANHQETA